MAASVQFFYHFRVMLLNAENNNIMIGAYEANREIKTRFGTLRYTLRYIIMIVIIIIIISIIIIINLMMISGAYFLLVLRPQLDLEARVPLCLASLFEEPKISR